MSSQCCDLSVDDVQQCDCNVIVGITIFRGSFVFSQSRVKVSANLTNVRSLAVGVLDLVTVSLSVSWLVCVQSVSC